jgi:quaternary ammonium compound-resistance protein SugE
MAWINLFIAGLFEIVWATGLKYTEGFSRLWPSIGTVGAMGVSFWFLAAALKSLPIDTAYAVWTGIGAAGTAILGIILFGESRDLLRITCIDCGRHCRAQALLRAVTELPEGATLTTGPGTMTSIPLLPMSDLE